MAKNSTIGYSPKTGLLVEKPQAKAPADKSAKRDELPGQQRNNLTYNQSSKQ